MKKDINIGRSHSQRCLCGCWWITENIPKEENLKRKSLIPKCFKNFVTSVNNHLQCVLLGLNWKCNWEVEGKRRFSGFDKVLIQGDRLQYMAHFSQLEVEKQISFFLLITIVHYFVLLCCKEFKCNILKFLVALWQHLKKLKGYQDPGL